MQELLLVNPRSRRAGAGRKRHRTAAQRAATKRLVALNRSRRGGSPAKRRTKRRAVAHAVAYAPNPIRRHKRRASNPMRRVRHHARYRRNPVGGAATSVMGMTTTAFQGALGGTLVNTALAYIPLPAAMQTGNMNYVTRGLAAILLGIAGRKVMPARLATNMAVGSLTITMHDAIKDIVGGMVPALKLGGVGYYTGGYPTSAVPAQLSAPARSAGRAMAGMGMYQSSEVGMHL